MPLFIKEDSFEIRLRQAITAAWEACVRKTGGGHITVNNEASLQLEYAEILKQLLPMTVHNPEESIDLLLGSPMYTPSGVFNGYGILNANSKAGSYKIAIKLKYYRKSPALNEDCINHEISIKDICTELQLLEEFINEGLIDAGVALVVKEIEGFVYHPGAETSYRLEMSESYIETFIGVEQFYFDISLTYPFNWGRHGDYLCAELEAIPDIVNF